MNRSIALAISAVTALAMSACASLTSVNDPAENQQYVSLVNSLTWTNPLTGKRDGLRSSWPLKTLSGRDELFPLAQLKQCDPAGEACAWGVMSAHRTVSKFHYLPAGVALELALMIDIDRSQEVHQPEFNAAMTIPIDVAALRSKKQIQRTLTLQYGKAQHIDFEHGVRFEVCVLRYDAAGRALDVCDIPYI